MVRLLERLLQELAYHSWNQGRKYPYAGPAFPIAANALIVPKVLQVVYGAEGTYWYFMLTVGIGEILSCGVLGIILYRVLRKTKIFEE